MASILSLPNELICLILESCDRFGDVVALSTTCKRINLLWRDNTPPIIWRVGTVCIPAFNDALAAARATRIVLNHFKKAELPPDPFPFHLLSGRSVKPSLQELKATLDLQQLITCVEKIFLDTTRWNISSVDGQPDPKAAWVKWREGFRRSMYRVFLAGAALCRAYQEPLSRYDPHQPPDFLTAMREARRFSVPSHWLVSNEELRYLARYTVFNFEAYEEHEPIYGPFADFLVQEAQHDALCNAHRHIFLPNTASTSSKLEKAEANALFTQTVQSLFAFFQFDGYKSDMHIFDSQSEMDEVETPCKYKSVPVILLGRFFPEMVLVPTDVEDEDIYFLVKTRIAPRSQAARVSPNLYSPFLRRILAMIADDTGQLTHDGGVGYTPQPPLQVFQFICRKFLGLRFAREAFEAAYPNISTLFAYNADIYLEDSECWPEMAWGIFDAVD